MSRIFFIFLLFIAALVRGPLSFLLIILKNLSGFLKKRIDFERKNLSQTECRSFKRDLIVADYCFEVSSEGELEQVRPLIEYYLNNKKRIEIIFASPSVENKCLKLCAEFNNQIRIMRLPIASFAPMSFLYFQSPWSWVTAPTIIFCRYDFFPELLSFKLLGKKLVLVSATGKNPSWFKDQAYSFFNLIVAANEAEACYFRKNFKGHTVLGFDFRVPRIFKRLELAPKTLGAVPELSTYISYIDSKRASLKLIMGSVWESDLVLFKNNEKWVQDIISGNIHLLIVPHNLDFEFIAQLKKSLTFLMPSVPIYEIKKGTELDVSLFCSNPGIVLFCMSGVLCELYSKFSFAYVGGGYERSIHSVLEPFLSGCQVAVGPKISRSTEYDNILDLAPNEIHLLNNPESFYNLVKANALKTPASGIRDNLRNNVATFMESIIKEIESC